MTSRTLTLGKSSYPVILPNTRDPRLHVAAVIITIHVLGQVGLRFQVSVPQILSAVLTCAVLEIVLTFRAQKAFVWPASAMLTGSGVALILRVPGTPPGDHWTTYRWYVFAGVAAFSLLTKYAIRYRGSHVFNPSNVGLVVAFLLLGSTRVEPLDFWWAPWTRWMILAYAVILVGGLLITARLQLLATAAVFWVGLAAGIGSLGRLRALHDRPVGVRARVRVRLLAGDRHVSRGADLPLLHAHGSEDGSHGTGRPRRVRSPRRGHQHPADGDTEPGIRNQGRPPRRAWCSSARLVPSSIGWCPSRGRRPMTFAGSRPGWRSPADPADRAEWSAVPSGSR